MNHTPPSPELFFETVNAYQRTEALRAAIELGLFSHIAAGKTNPTTLGAAAGANPRAIRILADFLTVIGFLEKRGTDYALPPHAAAFLDRKSPAYLGGTLEFLLTPTLRDSFSVLTQAVKQGGTALPDEGTVATEHPIWVEFARAMVPLMRMPAIKLAELIGGAAEQPLRVLDVAAGHGLFGITVAERYPQAQITALDWPEVLAVASEHATKAGIASRYQTRPGDAFQIDWGGPYDVILLTNFLHHFSAAECEQIAAKARQALAPNGRAIVLEYIPAENRIEPSIAASFALIMLATTAQGDAYTFAEYQQIFSRAGFARSEFHPLPPTPQQALVAYRD